MNKTILVLAANPKNTTPLRLDQEVREIDNGLQRAQRRDEFVLKQQWATRPIDVRRAMLDYKPSIVHFSGHGVGEEGIAFEDESGKAKLINADTLAGFFKLFADTVDCVVLNACYSEPQAEAIAKYIPYVIGMKKDISDSASIEFAVAFYDALGAGQSIEFAYNLACNAIQWSDIPENLTPTLIAKPRSLKQQEKLAEDRILLHLTPKLPCLLLLDTSGSMSGKPIQALTKGLQSFVHDLWRNPLALERVDLALIPFGSRASTVWDFAPVSQFHMPNLAASGTIAMGEAIELGLDLIGQRKQEYKRNGIPYYQPFVLLLTGGYPTDDWRASVNRLHKESSLRKLRFITVGIEGADMEILKQISPPGTTPLKLNQLRFSDMFLWLSSSMDSVSRSMPNEKIELPPPSWTVL